MKVLLKIIIVAILLNSCKDINQRNNINTIDKKTPNYKNDSIEIKIDKIIVRNLIYSQSRAKDYNNKNFYYPNEIILVYNVINDNTEVQFSVKDTINIFNNYFAIGKTIIDSLETSLFIANIEQINKDLLNNKCIKFKNQDSCRYLLNTSIVKDIPIFKRSYTSIELYNFFNQVSNSQTVFFIEKNGIPFKYNVNHENAEILYLIDSDTLTIDSLGLDNYEYDILSKKTADYHIGSY